MTIEHLRQEMDQILSRPRPQLAVWPEAPEQDAAALEQLSAATDLPDPVDPQGLVYRHQYTAGHAFGATLQRRPGEELMAHLQVLLGLECAWTAPADESLRPDQLLFLDIETTGLYPRGEADEEPEEPAPLAFTIGLGRWHPDDAGGFRVDQVFLQDPQREPEALELLQRYLRPARVLVSFNGRAFDWPVLRDRGLLHGVELELGQMAHLDLLPPSRRLFRPRLINCKQQTLERQVLGFRRVDDVPGAEVPGIYTRFLQHGGWGGVAGVLEHNRLDVALMAPLALRLAHHAALPLHWAEDAEELLACGRMHLEQGGDAELGRACLTRGLELVRVAATRRRLLAALARQRRRQGLLDEARSLWERYLEDFPQYNTGWVELAKYHEHVSRDLQRALSLTEGAPRHEPAVQHRLERLRRRVARM